MATDRLYPARPFIAASVAVFRDGRVLIAARARPPMELLYSLPGGLVEVGETLSEAALRELHEEVGVEADLLGFVDHVEAIERDDTRRVRHHFVICAHAARWRAGEPRIGSEATDVRWVREDEIAGFRTTPELARVLRKAFAMVKAMPA
jgi:8-oxo-dGTP diphosphatase